VVGEPFEGGANVPSRFGAVAEQSALVEPVGEAAPHGDEQLEEACELLVGAAELADKLGGRGTVVKSTTVDDLLHRLSASARLFLTTSSARNSTADRAPRRIFALPIDGKVGRHAIAGEAPGSYELLTPAGAWLLPGGPTVRRATRTKGMLVKNRLAALGLVAGLAGGTVIGVAVGVPALSSAQTPSPTTPTTTPGSSNNATAPSSNEDPTHEAGENADHEAAENNGTFHGGRHGSNEDPTHEAGESPAREAAEDAGTSGSTATTTAPVNG
jgi:hypothetical protein